MDAQDLILDDITREQTWLDKHSELDLSSRGTAKNISS
jgi:hypothetical protein